MKYKEVKEHYESGHLKRHFFIDESGNKCGEYRSYHENGGLNSHYLKLRGSTYGEIMSFESDGTLYHNCLVDGKFFIIASVISYDKPSTHSEVQLIQIAKERGLPLLSELPKSEEGVTLWNLKWPDQPYLPIEFE